jgi:hypothetical protein
MSAFSVHFLGGGTKQQMNERANEHFAALKAINPAVKRVVLFDYDRDDSWHPDPGNPVVREWTRTNIENYLLVPDAWKNAVLDAQNATEFDLYNDDYRQIIDTFFNEQGISLPLGFTWQNVKANIFAAVNGKRILFENSDSLFQRLKAKEDLKITREKVGNNMTMEMMHGDILAFFDFLIQTLD